jgi:hypothetical protein
MAAPEKGQLQVSSEANRQTSNLTGTGRAASVTLIPGDVTFPKTEAGTTSPPKIITLNNNGPDLGQIVIATTGDFAVSATTCGTTLATNSKCTISVTFAPIATGTRTGQLTVSDTARPSPQTAGLNGTGIPGKGVALTPVAVTFPIQFVSTTSAPKTFTLINNDRMVVNNIAISTTGDFAVSSTTCGTSLKPASNCTIDVTFTPTMAGPEKGQLQVSSEVDRKTSNLAGTGKAASVTLLPGDVTFPKTGVGATSPPKIITLNNNGPQLDHIVISLTGDFELSATTCGTSLAMNSKCTISVIFAPTATGTRTGQLTVSDSARPSPQTAGLNGTGTHTGT